MAEQQARCTNGKNHSRPLQFPLVGGINELFIAPANREARHAYSVGLKCSDLTPDEAVADERVEIHQMCNVHAIAQMALFRRNTVRHTATGPPRAADRSSVMLRQAVDGHVKDCGRCNLAALAGHLDALEFVQRPIHAPIQVDFISADPAVDIGVPDGICGNA